MSAVVYFYVASDFAAKQRALGAAEAVQAASSLELRARWLTEQPVLLEGGLGGELQGDQAAAAARVAQEDLEDIDGSQVFVQLTTGERARGGRHVELGYAIAKKASYPHRQVVVVGPREHAFHYHPGVTHLPDVEALAHWARGYSEGVSR